MYEYNKSNITEVLMDDNFVSDKKNKTNKDNTVVSLEVLQSIENGCPIEVLEKLNLPIFYYNTQITIHGTFPSLNVSNIGEYKNIFQNQNKSVGIKYSAIDWSKKEMIVKAIRLTKDNDFRVGYNSCDFYVYKAIEINGNALEVIQGLKNDIKSFPSDIVVGKFQIFMSNVYGVTFGVLKIDINAIYETNLWNFISLVTPFSCKSEFDTALAIKNEKDKIESDKRHKEYETNKLNQLTIKKAKYNELVSTLSLTKNVIKGGLYISHTDSYDVCVFKTDGISVWRYVECNWSSDNVELYQPLNKKDKKHRLDDVKSANVIKRIKETGFYLYK